MLRAALFVSVTTLILACGPTGADDGPPVPRPGAQPPAPRDASPAQREATPTSEATPLGPGDRQVGANWSRSPVYARHGAAATAHPLASQVAIASASSPRSTCILLRSS